MTIERDDYGHARGNAKGWYETIRDLYRESQDADADRNEEIDRAVDEDPLSVQVREPWHNPGEAAKPAEYEILLTTGGPGLRIWGELSEHGEPDGAQLQMQDWGVPWREIWPCEVEEMDEAEAALAWYVGHFYFGEG